MKKKVSIGIIIGLLILIVILIGIIFYFRHLDLNKEKYDATKEEQIGFISNWIVNLEECQGYSKFSPREEALDAGYSYYCFETTDIDDTNLNKLKALGNIKGILLEGNSSFDYNFTECNSLWELDYAWIAARVYHTIMNVYECEDKFYITTHSYPGAPTLTVYRINPSEEIINELRG
jgi:hypothetical protein